MTDNALNCSLPGRDAMPGVCTYHPWSYIHSMRSACGDAMHCVSTGQTSIYMIICSGPLYCLPFRLQFIGMVKVGQYNTLVVQRFTEFGAFLEDGKEGLLLPKRFVPTRAKVGDAIEVFVYHDSEDRMIATTQRPKAIVGEIAFLRAVTVTHQGAFLDWGLMKDLFVPRSKQLSGMRVGADYLVKIYIDVQTGRVAANEKIEFELSNEPLTVKEKDIVTAHCLPQNRYRLRSHHKQPAHRRVAPQ